MKRTSILAFGTGILLCMGLFAPGCGDDDNKDNVKRDAAAEAGLLDGPRGTGGTGGPIGTGGTVGGPEAGVPDVPVKHDLGVDKPGAEAQPVLSEVQGEAKPPVVDSAEDKGQKDVADDQGQPQVDGGDSVDGSTD